MARATLWTLVLSVTLAGSGCMSLARAVASSVAEEHGGAPESAAPAPQPLADDEGSAEATGAAAVYRHGPTYGWVDRPPAMSLGQLFGGGTGGRPPAAFCEPMPSTWDDPDLTMRDGSFRFPALQVRSTWIVLGAGSGSLEVLYATDPDVPARYRAPGGLGLRAESLMCDAAFDVTLWIGPHSPFRG